MDSKCPAEHIEQLVADQRITTKVCLAISPNLDLQGNYECDIDILEIPRGAVVLILGLIRRAHMGIRVYNLLASRY